MTAADYQKKLERDRRDGLDRLDPEKMQGALRAQGVKFTKIQMRTLVFDDREQLERVLRTTPEVEAVFICLVRDAGGTIIDPRFPPNAKL